MKLHDFENKHVYLVGGSSGIGLAIAEKLVGAGAHVMIISRTLSTLEAALNTLQEHKINSQQKIQITSLDVSVHQHTHETLNELVISFGVPDALINCAGRAIPQHHDEISYEQFDQTLKINLYGCRNTVAALIPHMKQKGGLIVNTASLAGIIGVFGMTDYSASKFALIGYSEALRSEVKKHNIKVMVLCPPDTDTPGFENENKTKPAETHAVSESASLLTTEQVAVAFFKALPKHNMLIVPGAAGKFSMYMKRLFPRVVEFVMDRDVKRVG
jgi:short-subunit dehydrogenase